MVCSPVQNKELFFGLPNSYGTLGYILSAKIALEPAKPYVDVEYCHENNITAFFQKMKGLCKNHEKYDFIDGAIFSPDNMVIVTGKAVDVPSYTHAADYLKKEIYYKAIQTKSAESFPIKEYLWRWDRDSFWSTENLFLQNPKVRSTIGPFILRADRLSRCNRFIQTFYNHVIAPFSRPKTEQEEVIQDIAIPMNKGSDFYHWLKNEIKIHPIFICPIKQETLPTPLWTSPTSQMHVDFGLFATKADPLEPNYYNRKIEEYLHKIGGKKSLYSRSYYSKEQFEKLYYNNGTYEKLKQLYDPQHRFPTLFDKCVRNR
ncbi:MAG TPA: hypothetical protein VLE95_03690 [Chlamydiales bacterium]|nr:hypothetical protein [Chlamydiales bacterium]